jgi:hypothetical protein
LAFGGGRAVLTTGQNARNGTEKKGDTPN